MNKTKLVAMCGLCSAVAVGSLVLSCYVSQAVVAFAVVAGIAVAIPTMADSRYLGYSLLTWVASSVLGLLLSVSKLHFVVPVVFFAMPFSIWKCFCESSPKNTDTNIALDDPFEKDKQIAVTAPVTMRIKTLWKYVVYYLLLQIALGLTALAMYLFLPAVLQTLLQKGSIWWLLAVCELAVFPFDMLMSGALKVVGKGIKKYFKQ